jgi:hypothetical protein
MNNIDKIGRSFKIAGCVVIAAFAGCTRPEPKPPKPDTAYQTTIEVAADFQLIKLQQIADAIAAQTEVINKLIEVVEHQTQIIERLDSRLDSANSSLDSIKSRLDNMDGHLLQIYEKPN